MLRCEKPDISKKPLNLEFDKFLKIVFLYGQLNVFIRKSVTLPLFTFLVL